MKKKFFIGALAVSLLLTLFSCKEIEVEKNTEGVVSLTVPTVSGYKQRVIDVPSGYLYEIITPKDTFLVFSKYQTGMVLLKQSPVK
jgi:hypothetical protein|nr:MAG TPA: protein of unknown function (DUF5016) [Caudoviricetes sp.]